MFDQEFPIDETGRYSEAFPEELKRMDIDGISYSEGGWMENEEGKLEARWSKVQGNFGDTLTLRFINWDNEVMGTVQFRLQK